MSIPIRINGKRISPAELGELPISLKHRNWRTAARRHYRYLPTIPCTTIFFIPRTSTRWIGNYSLYPYPTDSDIVLCRKSRVGPICLCINLHSVYGTSGNSHYLSDFNHCLFFISATLIVYVCMCAFVRIRCFMVHPVHPLFAVLNILRHTSETAASLNSMLAEIC